MSKHQIVKRDESTVLWKYWGKTYKCQILPQLCPACCARALVGLPTRLREEQPDKTNVVCLTILGGCNHGYELDIDAECLSCEWEIE